MSTLIFWRKRTARAGIPGNDLQGSLRVARMEPKDSPVPLDFHNKIHAIRGHFPAGAKKEEGGYHEGEKDSNYRRG